MAEQRISIGKYIQYLKTFKRSGNLNVGRFYVYNYDFSKEYPWDELKFYDFMPLTFVFEIDPINKGFIGINFHHMPLRPRQLWINRIEKLAQRIDDKISHAPGLGGRPVYKINGLNYPRVYKILRKSKIAIRRYRFDRVSDLRMVDLGEIREVMRWSAKTYLGVTIKQIQNRYMQYVPKS